MSSTSEPYYDVDGITIYNADCSEVFSVIDPLSVDLLLTDPPYGIDHQTSSYWGHGSIYGDDEPFDPGLVLKYGRCVLFGADNYADRLPPSRGWIIWDKRDRVSHNLPGADVEMAWTNVSNQARLFRYLWMPHTMRKEPPLHPNQKPVALMRWIVERWTEPGDLVFDPYMGSGPVARACLDLGRQYVGVEIVEEYCDIAVKRLAQLALPL